MPQENPVQEPVQEAASPGVSTPHLAAAEQPLRAQSGPVTFPVIMPSVSEYPVSFTGTPGEYFRVWIVNYAFTILTLGLFWPWARARNRRYFYEHTLLDGQNFNDQSNPRAMLVSHLLLMFVILPLPTFVLAQVEPSLNVYGALLLLIAPIYPWLVWLTLRYQTSTVVHRGLRFGFTGRLGGSYAAYLWWNAFGALTLGLGLPYAWYRQRTYQVNHLKYGAAAFTFKGQPRVFSLIGLGGLGLLVLAAVGLLLVLGLLLLFAVKFIRPVVPDLLTREALIYYTIFLGVVGLLGAYLLAWQYVRGAILAYLVNHTELASGVCAHSSLQPRRLMWLTLTNILAQVVTLGLATPWATIRIRKYILESVRVYAPHELDDFMQGESRPGSAFGEVTTNLLDIQVGV